VNVGAFIAPLVCGNVGRGSRLALAARRRGCGHADALAVYLIGFNTLPENELTKSRARIARKSR